MANQQADAAMTALVSTAINGLNQQLAVQNATEMVPSYSHPQDGSIRDWIRELDKIESTPTFEDGNMILLAWRKSKGVVSDYINRWRLETGAPTWAGLREQLLRRFGDVVDEQQALSILRSASQRKQETVQAFSERLFDLARRAYGAKLQDAQTKDLINHELVGILMDGLLSHSLKVKVFRAKPATLQEAIEVALEEELLHKRFPRQPRASQNDDPSGVLPVTPTSSRNSSLTRSPSPMPSRFRQARSPTPTSSILRKAPTDAGASNRRPVESYRRSYRPPAENRENNDFRQRTSPQPWNRDQARPSRREAYGQSNYRDSQRGFAGNNNYRDSQPSQGRYRPQSPAQRGQGPNNTGYSRNRNVSWRRPIESRPEERRRYCYSCGSPHHLWRQCPIATQYAERDRRTDQRRPVTCYTCGQTGHVARYCNARQSNDTARGM